MLNQDRSIWYRPASTPEERGIMAEEKFFQAWSVECIPNWMVTIDRPTEHEDFFEKTDAVIIPINGPNLRIQIKSFPLEEEECEELMECGVIPLWVQYGQSLRSVREQTLDAIQKFKDFIKNQPSTFTKIAPCNQESYIWYKKGKKYYRKKKQ